jgi:hypothetical protein
MSDKETRRKLKRERMEELSSSIDVYQTALEEYARASDAFDATCAGLRLIAPEAYRETIAKREAHLFELSKGSLARDTSSYSAEIQGKLKKLRETVADLNARTVADSLDGIALEPPCESRLSSRSV